MSRPSCYSQAIADTICDRIACGENINVVSGDEGMPAQSTIYKWLGEHAEFSANYAQARVRRADARSDRVDDYKRRMLSGELTPDVAHKAFDMERWQAGKENPRKYGDKVMHGGDPDGVPVAHTLSHSDEAIIAQALALATRG